MTRKNRKNYVAQKHIPYEDIVRDNPNFIRYYQKQAICPQSEWDEFLKYLRSNLPTTFRITASKTETKQLVNFIKNELCDLLKTRNNTEQLPELQCFSWYPEELAWQIDLSRRDVRREPALARLHQFLIIETENGTISRQEAVSMIPTLLLDVQSHHKVLDMCASPGSKTAQIIEHLHANDTKIPSGFVIANDVDNKRCYMLVHQAKRLNSPSVLITNHDGAVFPKLMINNKQDELKFDRILCDAPCTGDGTMRKNPDIWMKWNVGNSINHHNIQYRILKRGFQLLKIGGRLVYSTCSLNPLENEAVINRIVIESKNALKVVDVNVNLSGLKFSNGLKKWFVTNKTIDNFYEKFDEVPSCYHALIRPQMFPSDDPEIANQLEKCIRILPHQQNSGGFFIAVLEKIYETHYVQNPHSLPTRPENPVLETFSGPRAKRPRRANGYKEDPYVFFNADTDVWPKIAKFFKISPNFDPHNLLTRCCEGKKKNIYYCSPSVHDLVYSNVNVLKCVNTGVKVFVRCDNKNDNCAFRLCHEGLDSIIDHLGYQRRVEISKNDLVKILFNNDPENAIKIEDLSENTKTILQNFEHGSCVLVLKQLDEPDLNLKICGWRGIHTIRAYISNINAIHYLRILGEDVSKLEEKFFNKFNKPNQENDDAEIKKDCENSNDLNKIDK